MQHGYFFTFNLKANKATNKILDNSKCIGWIKAGKLKLVKEIPAPINNSTISNKNAALRCSNTCDRERQHKKMINTDVVIATVL